MTSQLLRLTAELPGIIYRNREFARILAATVFTMDSDARFERKTELITWIRTKNLMHSRSKNRAEMKGFADKILTKFPELKEHLKRTKHFGYLADLAGPLPHSRLDYVLAHATLLSQVKEGHQGLGLGSKGGSTDTVRFQGESLTGLEIAQLWTVLVNLGHLFGTFATERALLYWLRKDSEEIEEFLDKIHPSLRSSVREIIDEGCMYKFYYALACWRLSIAEMPEDWRETCVRALSLFANQDVCSERLRLIKQVYRATRRVTYLRIHSAAHFGAFGSHLDSQEIMRDVLPGQSIVYDGQTNAPNSTNDLLDALDAFQFDKFFTGKESAAIVLNHLREFKTWWKKKKSAKASINERVAALFEKPSDWPTIKEQPQSKHFLRIDIPNMRKEWHPELAKWLKGNRDDDPWRDANFYLTYSPLLKHLRVDVYAPNHLSNQTLFHIATQLGIHCEKSWQCGDPKLNEIIWRSVSRFGILLFNQLLTNDHRARLEPVDAEQGSRGFALLCNSFKDGLDHCKGFCDKLRNEPKKVETKGIIEYLQDNPPNGEFAFLLFLGILRIWSGNKTKKEIDGVAAFIRDDRVDWLLFEHKAQGQRSPSTQLNEIKGFLAAKISEIKQTTLNEGKIAVAHISWLSKAARFRMERADS